MRRLTFSLFLLISCIVQAQPVFFEKAFGGPETEIAKSVREFPDGTLMVGGIRSNGPFGGYDFVLARLNRSGNLIWTRFFGTSQDDNCLYMNTCADGNLIMAGETFSATNLLDGFIVKTDTAGNELWRKVISTPVNESIRFIIETSDKGFVCAGYQNDAQGSNDSWFLRLDSVGEVIWSQAYGAWSTEYADMIRELPDGRFIATGDTKSMGNGGYDVELFLLDEAGVPEFDLTYGDQFQNGCQGVIILSDGNFLSFGETEIYTNSSFEMFLEKIDTSGNSLWRRTFGGSGTDAAFSVVEQPDHSFMITGYTTSAGSGPLNLAVAKADSAGYLQWMRAYGSTGIDIGYDLQPAMEGGYLIAGRTAPSDDQFYILHVDNAGLLTGTRETDKLPEISLYPNPATEQVNLVSSRNIKTVSIVDMQGREVYTAYCGSSFLQVDLKNLPAGIYTVAAQMDTGMVYQKLLVFQLH